MRVPLFLLLAAQAILCADRPRIGLVLEGGGALGIAHIGVLEWLEENRIPVDLITGTSMGALIGGLYASGMTPRELRELVASIDWDLTIGGQVPYSALSYRRKEDRIAYPNRLEFGLRDGLQFQAGLNSGHQIGLILSRALLDYRSLNSFDELPTAFRCVATEMISGKTVVFDKGSLVDALRASMSLPAIFTPARQDGKIYTDGAILNNLPVDVAKRMGVDIIIAVHLSTGPVDPKQLRTFTGTLGRSVGIVVSTNEMRNMQLADIVLMTDLAGFGSADYKAAGALIARGRDAADAKHAILRRFQVDPPVYQALLDKRRQKKPAAERKPVFVELEGASGSVERSIERRLEPFLNHELAIGVLEREITRVVGLGRFESLDYGLVERNGVTGLFVRAQEKSHGPPFFQPAVEIDGKDQSNVGFLFLSRLTVLDLGGFRAEWRTDVSFGSRYGIATEYYRPVRENSPFFVAPRAFVQNSRVDVYSGTERQAQYQVNEYGLGGDFGVTFSRFAELRAGYLLGRITAKRDVGSAVYPSGGFRNDTASLRFAYEGQDDAVIPRRGLRLASSLKYSPESSLASLTQMELRTSFAKPITPRSSLLTSVAGGTSFASREIGIRSFTLGAPSRLGAYGPNELRGYQYYLLSAGYIRDIWTLPPLAGDKLYFTSIIQAGRMNGSEAHRGVPLSITGLFVAKTLLGPVYLGGSLGDRGHRRWFFGLGRVF